MDKEKSKSPTLPPNPSRSSTSYKKPTVEILSDHIDRSQYQAFFDRTQPGPSTTSNKANTHSHTKNFDKFDFRSLSPINSSASEKADSNQDSVVSDHFHTTSRKIVQLPRDWWKVDLYRDIQMQGFKKLFEVNPCVPDLISDDKITLFSKLDEAQYVVDLVDEKEPKSYWEEVNEPNGQVWKEAMDRELNSLDRAGTWHVVDKIEGGKEVGSKWAFKIK
jgi:hypothetical protein